MSSIHLLLHLDDTCFMLDNSISSTSISIACCKRCAWVCVCVWHGILPTSSLFFIPHAPPIRCEMQKEDVKITNLFVRTTYSVFSLLFDAPKRAKKKTKWRREREVLLDLLFRNKRSTVPNFHFLLASNAETLFTCIYIPTTDRLEAQCQKLHGRHFSLNVRGPKYKPK